MTTQDGATGETGAPGPEGVPTVIDDFCRAVRERDSAAVGRLFTPDADYYMCMPREPVRGAAAIATAFASFNERYDRIEFDIVNWARSGDRIWFERVDNFTAGDRTASIECNGILELDPESGLITEIRDYADMQTWLERSATA